LVEAGNYDDAVFFYNVENRVGKFAEQNAARFFVNCLIGEGISFDGLQSRVERAHKFKTQTFDYFFVIIEGFLNFELCFASDNDFII